VLYAPHGRDQLELLARAFESRNPDIDLRWLDMGSQEVFDRIRSERANPQADVWFGGPTTIFDRGVADSLLQSYRPAWAAQVGPRGVGPGELYWPVYRTPAVISFNSRAVPRDEAPTDWDEVLEPKWRDKVLIRDPMASGTMRAIWGLILYRSIKATGDAAQGMAWLRRLDGQTRAYALNPSILNDKLARQEGVLTLWDLPDVLIDKARGRPLDYVFPSSGTVVIDDAIALVRGARHAEAARRCCRRSLGFSRFCSSMGKPASPRTWCAPCSGCRRRRGGSRDGSPCSWSTSPRCMCISTSSPAPRSRDSTSPSKKRPPRWAPTGGPFSAA
jgi:iron(III) transport system substrate-binding protein